MTEPACSRRVHPSTNGNLCPQRQAPRYRSSQSRPSNSRKAVRRWDSASPVRRCGDGFHVEGADAKSLAVLEQMVETGTGRDCGLVIEQIAQNLLHLPDVRTNAERAAELFL